MSNLNLHNLTKKCPEIPPVSVPGWRLANEIAPRDHNRPQFAPPENSDPQATEFLIDRSGQWLPLAHFSKLPVPRHRSEFIFGTAGEGTKMLTGLPSKPAIPGRDTHGTTEATSDETT